MNLNNLVSGAISTINPWVTATLQRSTGSTKDSSYHRTPAYSTPEQIRAQVQSLSMGELSQIEGLNLQGEKRAIYIDGLWEGVSRAESKGGDLVTLSDASVWLVVHVLENWSLMSGWSKVAVVRQLP